MYVRAASPLAQLSHAPRTTHHPTQPPTQQNPTAPDAGTQKPQSSARTCDSHPRPPRLQALLPLRHELREHDGARLLARSGLLVVEAGEVLEDEDVVVAVVRVLARPLRRPAPVAAVEVARAPADAVGLAARLLAGRVKPCGMWGVWGWVGRRRCECERGKFEASSACGTKRRGGLSVDDGATVACGVGRGAGGDECRRP